MKTAIRNGYTPKTGDYCEMIVVDKENQSAYIFDCDGVFTEMPQPIDVERILEEAAAYTDEAIEPLKEKLDTIEEGAQENVIEVVQKNGTPLTITNKTVNVTVPTKTSDLENDSGFIDDLSNYYTKTEVDQEIGTEESARILADNNLQSQIDAITAGSDVVDIVGTKADLDDYDTSGLSANDIIKVLTDETEDDATTYYRWTGSVWQYIGAEGPFYTKSEADSTFVPQTRTINSKALTANITLTAQDVGALPDSTVIPTVNDATLTIQQNGSTLDTFTANSATNKTVNIAVPTKTSDLENDSGFVTEDEIFDEDCVEGENINFEAPAASPLSSFSLKGNTEQSGTPTPSAPVAVKTVTGENVVKITGKNLVYPEPRGSASNGLTAAYNADSGNITISGTATTTWSIPFATVQQPLPAGTYTLKQFGTLTTGTLGMNFNYVDGTASGDKRTNASTLTVTFTLTKPVLSCYVFVGGLSNGAAVSGTVQLQLEKGSTATDFEPYQEQSYEVNLGKNLFDKDNDVLSTRCYLSGNTASTQLTTITDAAISRTLLVRLEEGQTYTIQKKASGRFRFGFTTTATPAFNTNGVITSRLANADTSSSVTFTVPTGSPYFVCNFFSNDQAADVQNGYDVIVNSIQIEKGSTATDYAEYFTPIELCKLGGYQDYIYKSGDKWYVHKEVGKYIFDGSESFTSDGSYNNIYQYRWTDSSVISATDQNTVFVISDKFKGVAYTGSWTLDFTVTQRANNPALRFMTSTSSSISDFKTWLASSNTTVYYVLATPAEGEITNAALIEQLEAILAGHTYAGINNITTTIAAGNAQGELEICYYNTSLPIATTSTPGIVQIGDGIDVDNGTISVDLPTKTSDLTNDGENGTSTYVEAADLATVATSGNYNDLSNKPTIPTVNDATLTIQKNGTNVATFTANSSTNQTANITVPVNTSELINDSGFLTSAALSNYYTKSETYTQGEVNSLINSIAVPTKTSDLTNDGADGTSTYVETAEIAPSTLVVEYSSGYTQYYNPLDGNNTYIAITNNAFSGASASIGGRAGLVPAPSAGDQDKYLKGDGTWATVQGGGGTTTVFYVDINDFITYTSNTITLYTDDTLTTAVTPSQLATAYAAGDVVIGCIDNSIQEGTITIIARLEDQYSSGFVEYTAVSYSWTDDGNGNMTSQANIFVITADESTNSPQMGFIVSRVQDKLTAGNNISISSNNTISASIPIDSALDVSSSNPVENSVVTAAINNKADASDLADYVTLATTQNITGEKTFVGDKRIKFKGVNSSSKLGFTMYDQNNAEVGFLEATGQGNASKKNLLGIYDNSGSATRTNYLGFQYYNTHPTSGSTVAYSLVAPPLYRGVTSVNSYAYIPVEFTDGNATVKAGTDGIVDLSTIMPASQDALIIREWS